MTLKLGLITIGQSPRIDIVPEIKDFLPDNIEILEKGALDNLTPLEVKNLAPQRDGELLVTRLRDGTEVIVGESFIMPRLQGRISELNQEGVALIALLCSGEFPLFHSEKPLIMPDKLLYGVLSGISIKGALGIMVPSARQVGFVRESFQKIGFKTVGVSASPYGDEESVVKAAEQLKGKVDLSVLNCFGYNLRIKSIVAEITQRPVILVRSILARTLAELIC